MASGANRAAAHHRVLRLKYRLFSFRCNFLLEFAEESNVFQATVSDPVNLPRLDAALAARQSDSFDILNQRKKK